MSGCAPAALGEFRAVGQGTLTLRTDGPLPAFFADTREGVAVDHTGAPIMARVGQATTVPGYETRTDRTTIPEDPEASGEARTSPTRASHRCPDHGHRKPPVRQKTTYVAGRPFPASGTHALESIPFIIAGAAVVARGLVTLAVTWRRRRGISA